MPLAVGQIVQATARRKRTHGEICGLETELTGMLTREDDWRDCDLADKLLEGDIRTCKKNRYQMSSACREDELKSVGHRPNENLVPLYHENHSSLPRKQEKASRDKEFAKKHFKPRIDHPCFQNITADEAMEPNPFSSPTKQTQIEHPESSSQSENSLASTASDRTIPTSLPNGNAKEEKVVVVVRLRPLNKREEAANDQVAWACIDDKIVEPVNPPSTQRPRFTFDKVFGPLSSTETVYEEGVKNVALSALTGINATILAYGQTSSGKTFTMGEITKKAVIDVYNHIMNTPERDFTVKISGLEIYQENVRDLLGTGLDLKLFDDEKNATVVVHGLVEEIASDANHLLNLISKCEAQRQVGGTALNDYSSRSHQIIRLTIQSTPRESSGCIKSYVARLNLVDLAGNERVSQSGVRGTGLIEASLINRSLTTLGIVIKKLSDGVKQKHINYRDSKLTRILKYSLGGNGRTAIICTLSPARSHFQQSHDTLNFATRAKEVTNNTRVNMVVSDKQLVKKLQKEVGKLEADVGRLEADVSEKDMKIQQMEKENKDLRADVSEKDMKIQQTEKEKEDMRRQIDAALCEIEELRQKVRLQEKLREEAN